MKFVKEELSGKEKTRYVFALGRSEAIILLALLKKAIRYEPRTFQTMTTEAHMRNMARGIGRAIKEMEPSNEEPEEEVKVQGI